MPARSVRGAQAQKERERERERERDTADEKPLWGLSDRGALSHLLLGNMGGALSLLRRWAWSEPEAEEAKYW